MRGLTATEQTIKYLIEELKERGLEPHILKMDINNKNWDKHPEERRRQNKLLEKIIAHIPG